MTDQINELVNKCLFAYAEMARLDPGEENRGTIKQWKTKELIKDLNLSRELDKTGLTTFMLLRGLVDHFISNAKFSAKSIFLEPEAFHKRIREIKSVFDITETPAIISVIEAFQAKLREMAKRYQVKNMDAFEALLQDKYHLAYLRRDALKSIDSLEAFQFTQGQPSSKPLQLNAPIYEFWNINSLLAGLRAQTGDGISLCLIRDPRQVMASYFLFAVKNGETITVLTDREEGPHPAYWQMSRRPDRALERRAEQHWFPYDLLEFESTARGELYACHRDQIVPYNLEAVKLSTIGKLAPEQIVWCGLLLDLINERYGRENRLLPELAYTGEMVANPEALVGSGGSLVLQGHYRPLDLPRLKPKDITARKTRAQWERKPEGHNEWMIKAYGLKVPEKLLNPVGTRDLPAIVAEATKTLRIQKASVDAETLSPVTFGSREKLEKDRLWVARVNQCRTVQALAEKDFKANKDRVLRWCSKKLQANQKFIFDAVVEGSLFLPVAKFASEGGGGFPAKDRLYIKEKECLRQVVDNAPPFISEEEFYFGRYMWTQTKRPERRATFNGWACAIHPQTKASIFTEILISCPQALARVLGVEVKDLPLGLQHYYTSEPYTGNSILDRCDPSDWVLENPWNALRLNVGVMLSRSGMRELRKARSLPPKTF